MSLAPNKNQPSSWVKYSGLGFQMAGTIFLMAWLGTYLDKKYAFDKPYITLVCLLFGVIVAFYQVFKALANK